MLDLVIIMGLGRGIKGGQWLSLFFKINCKRLQCVVLKSMFKILYFAYG